MTIIGRITWRSEAENFQARNGEDMTLQRIGAERDAIILVDGSHATHTSGQALLFFFISHSFSWVSKVRGV